jgi:hypothetical protein
VSQWRPLGLVLGLVTFVRLTGETSDTIRTAAMKQPAIFSPSGRSTMLATVVTAEMSVISAYAHVIRSRRRADSVPAPPPARVRRPN